MKVVPITQTQILLDRKVKDEPRWWCWGCSKARDKSERVMVGKAARCVHCWDKTKSTPFARNVKNAVGA